jgi:hypothetical protein
MQGLGVHTDLSRLTDRGARSSKLYRYQLKMMQLIEACCNSSNASISSSSSDPAVSGRNNYALSVMLPLLSERGLGFDSLLQLMRASTLPLTYADVC